MNCEEVMELMQRHLDGDLDSEEFKEMTSHLERCPECAEMMERLKQVDQDLANLPKVTPSFSLVDAIMPKLVQIDAAAESSSASTLEADRRENGRNVPWYTRYRLAGIGGAAAAVILGIMIMNGLPERGAEIAYNTAKPEAASSSASADTMIMSAAEESSPGPPGSAEAANDMSVSDEGMANSDTSNSSVPMEAHGKEGVQEMAERHEPLSMPLSAATEDHAGQMQRMAPNADEPVGSAAAPSRMEDKDSSVHGISALPAEPTESEETVRIAGEMSVAEAPGSVAPRAAAAGLASNDGVYLAVIKEQHDGTVVVAVNEADGDVVTFQSKHRWNPGADIVELEAWNRSTLTYKVTTERGVRKFSIDAANGKEAELSN